MTKRQQCVLSPQHSLRLRCIVLNLPSRTFDIRVFQFTTHLYITYPLKTRVSTVERCHRGFFSFVCIVKIMYLIVEEPMLQLLQFHFLYKRYLNTGY